MKRRKILFVIHCTWLSEITQSPVGVLRSIVYMFRSRTDR